MVYQMMLFPVTLNDRYLP